jgi:hypothetical protein
MGHVTCSSFSTHTRVETTKYDKIPFHTSHSYFGKNDQIKEQEGPFLPKINNNVLKLQHPKMGWESKTKELKWTCFHFHPIDKWSKVH